MPHKESVLIVVDPTKTKQSAVERGMYIAKRRGWRAELFICGYSPQLVGSQFLSADKLERAKRGYLADQKSLLATLAEPFVEVGIDVTVSACWDRPLYEGIIRQALRSDARLVIKDTHYHSKLERTLFTNTDWHLIQDCPAPLWLVRPGPALDAPVMLVAVDPMHENEKPANLDFRLLSEAFEFADQLEGVVHAFHAFNPFVDPGDPKRIETAHEQGMRALIDEFQIPEQRVHVLAGNAVDMLPQLAEEIGASAVVMGSVSRSRLEHAIIGSTAENLLDLLPCDVLIVKPRGFVTPVSFKCAPDGVIYATDA